MTITSLPARLLIAGLWICLAMPPVIAGEQFGRFFTTPSQRQKLDELRKIEPEQRLKIDEQELLVEEVVEEKEEVSVGTLTVRGLVHRSDGKNTAWVNESNTFEGGLSSQYINIGDIENNRVEIKIPTAGKNVELNVGQSFDPISESYSDLVDDESTTVTGSGPAD